MSLMSGDERAYSKENVNENSYGKENVNKLECIELCIPQSPLLRRTSNQSKAGHPYLWSPWKTHWVLALVKGIGEPHEVKKKFFWPRWESNPRPPD